MKGREEKGKRKYIIMRKRQIEKGTEKKKYLKGNLNIFLSEINRGIKRICITIKIPKTIIIYIVVLLSETMTTK